MRAVIEPQSVRAGESASVVEHHRRLANREPLGPILASPFCATT